MKHLKISSFFGEYDVNIFPETASIDENITTADLLLLDEKLKEHLSGNITQSIALEALEENKTLNKCGDVLEQFKLFNLQRNDSVIVAGGGIMQDIGTLSCSLYMRGVRWDYFPSTLLAMVDSCIGGKSAINHGNFKNIVGNYYPPKTVNIFPKFCQTLDNRKVIEGVFEAIKICFAKGSAEYEKARESLVFGDGKLNVHYSELIFTSISAKKYFIELDEFDRGPRLLLNFGHTFGHALEAASKFKISHGIAVGLGMLMACKFAQDTGLVKSESLRVQKLKNDIYLLLRSVGNVKEMILSADKDNFYHAFDSDKKHSQLSYKMVLPSSNGSLEIVTIDRNKENKELVKNVFLSLVGCNEIL